MEYSLRSRGGHIEVIDSYGRFVFSADTASEARQELHEMEASTGNSEREVS